MDSKPLNAFYTFRIGARARLLGKAKGEPIRFRWSSYRQAGWWIEYLFRRMDVLSYAAWHLASMDLGSQIPTRLSSSASSSPCMATSREPSSGSIERSVCVRFRERLRSIAFCSRRPPPPARNYCAPPKPLKRERPQSRFDTSQGPRHLSSLR